MRELNTNYIGHGILGEIWSLGYLIQISWGNEWYHYLPPLIMAIGSGIMIYHGIPTAQNFNMKTPKQDATTSILGLENKINST